VADDYKNPAESFSLNAVSLPYFTTLFGTAGNDTMVCKESLLKQSLLNVYLLQVEASSTVEPFGSNDRLCSAVQVQHMYFVCFIITTQPGN